MAIALINIPIVKKILREHNPVKPIGFIYNEECHCLLLVRI